MLWLTVDKGTADTDRFPSTTSKSYKLFIYIDLYFKFAIACDRIRGCKTDGVPFCPPFDSFLTEKLISVLSEVPEDFHVTTS